MSFSEIKHVFDDKIFKWGRGVFSINAGVTNAANVATILQDDKEYTNVTLNEKGTASVIVPAYHMYTLVLNGIIYNPKTVAAGEFVDSGYGEATLIESVKSAKWYAEGMTNEQILAYIKEYVAFDGYLYNNGVKALDRFAGMSVQSGGPDTVVSEGATAITLSTSNSECGNRTNYYWITQAPIDCRGYKSIVLQLDQWVSYGGSGTGSIGQYGLQIQALSASNEILTSVTVASASSLVERNTHYFANTAYTLDISSLSDNAKNNIIIRFYGWCAFKGPMSGSIKSIRLVN